MTLSHSQNDLKLLIFSALVVCIWSYNGTSIGHDGAKK